MTKVGKVFSLYYSPAAGRTATSSFDLDGKGILNDKHYDKKVERSVLLATLESYALAKEHGIDVPHGALGENILMDYNPYHLNTGAQLQIGSVVLEISQHCTLCKSLTQVNSKLPKLLKNDRGIFAKVIKPGCIIQGDDIYLLGL